MAFCNKCGAQLEDNQRFCGKCGNEVTAKAAAPAAVTSAPAPVAQAVAPPPQGYAAPPPPGYAAPPPQGYPAPGPMPVVVGAPPAPSKGRLSAVMWTLVVVAAVLAGLYYIGTHYQPAQTGTNPTPASTPGQQPGSNPAQPGGQQPGGAPAQPGENMALVKQQAFTFGQPYNSNGYIEVPGAKWTNNSNVALQSATLECDQEDAAGNPLVEMRSTLTGPNNAPVQPGVTVPFNTLQMGDWANNGTKVVCAIVHVKPAS